MAAVALAEEASWVGGEPLPALRVAETVGGPVVLMKAAARVGGVDRHAADRIDELARNRLRRTGVVMVAMRRGHGHFLG